MRLRQSARAHGRASFKLLRYGARLTRLKSLEGGGREALGTAHWALYSGFCGSRGLPGSVLQLQLKLQLQLLVSERGNGEG
jgi:hypothetical protein